MIFDQVSRYMYADDTPEDETPSAIRAELIQQAVFDPTLRPKINPQTIIEFVANDSAERQGTNPAIQRVGRMAKRTGAYSHPRAAQRSTVT